MVAMTSVATITVMVALRWDASGSLGSFLLMVGCSATATIFIFSHLHLELKVREVDTLREARTDPLTGLPNRKALIEEVEQSIADCQSQGVLSCLVLLDLNDFKNVNDALGHDIGDELLNQVAGRLRDHLPNDRAYRLGGDEFAVILREYDLFQGGTTCRKLHSNIAGTYLLGYTRAGVGCSIGIAQIEPGLSASDALRRSDLAMYKAKKSQTFVELFDQAMLDEVQRKSELSDRLRAALDEGAGIALKYQPIFSREKRIVALEAYFRWHDEEYGSVSPTEAIQIARLTQQIDKLSLLVAERACELVSSIPDTRMCLNIEAIQILDTRFSEALEEMIASKGLCNSCFQLEFDESEFVAYGTKIAPVLNGLAASGFHVAVDNYGSSTSSLTELRSMGVGELKLDDSLLAQSRDTGNISILRAKVNLAATLGMKVTCKGIGDMEDEAIALQAGCDYLQGFKYGRPDSAAVFVKEAQHIPLNATG